MTARARARDRRQQDLTTSGYLLRARCILIVDQVTTQESRSSFKLKVSYHIQLSNMAASKPKKEKLPRGVARLPQWWLEVTPHRTLNIEAEEYRRKAEEEQAVMYANLAAKQDYEQKYGAGSDGGAAGGASGAGAASGGGYQRGARKSIDQGGVGPDGRQFKAGETPEGYVPGAHGDGSGPGASQRVSLSSPSAGQYARDEDKQWEKPDWMKVKLKHTGTGDNIRKGEYGADGKGVDTGKIKKSILPPDKDSTASEAPADQAAAAPAQPKIVKRVVKRVSKKKVAKAPEPQAPAVPEPISEPAQASSEFMEEEVVDEEYYEEEVVVTDDDEGDFVEEIIVEDEDGNEIYEDGERR